MFNNAGTETRDEFFSGDYPFGGSIMLWPRYVKNSEGLWVDPPEGHPTWKLVWAKDRDSEEVYSLSE